MNCKSCNKELKPVFSEVKTKVQFDNALQIDFIGGYGMFIDNLVWEEYSDYSVIICHECAHALCSMIPWIENLLQPETSHQHVEE